MPRSAPPPAVYKKKTNDVVVYRPPQSGGFGESMKQGFALGTGHALAHHTIGTIVRAFSTPEPTVQDCTVYTKCLGMFDRDTCDVLYETCASKQPTPLVRSAGS